MFLLSSTRNKENKYDCIYKAIWVFFLKKHFSLNFFLCLYFQANSSSLLSETFESDPYMMSIPQMHQSIESTKSDQSDLQIRFEDLLTNYRLRNTFSLKCFKDSQDNFYLLLSF